MLFQLAIYGRLNTHLTTVKGLFYFSVFISATACTPVQHYNYSYLSDSLGQYTDNSAQTLTNPQVDKINKTRVTLGALQDEINHLESQILPKAYMDQTLLYLDNTTRTPYAPLPDTAIIASEEIKYLQQESRRNSYNTTIINEQRALMTRIQTLKQKQISLYEDYIELIEQYKQGK